MRDYRVRIGGGMVCKDGFWGKRRYPRYGMGCFGGEKGSGMGVFKGDYGVVWCSVVDCGVIGESMVKLVY